MDKELEILLQKGLKELCEHAEIRGYLTSPYGRLPHPTPLISEYQFLENGGYDEVIEEINQERLSGVKQNDETKDYPPFEYSYGFDPLLFLSEFLLKNHPEAKKNHEENRLEAFEKNKKRIQHSKNQLKIFSEFKEYLSRNQNNLLYSPFLFPILNSNSTSTTNSSNSKSNSSLTLKLFCQSRKKTSRIYILLNTSIDFTLSEDNKDLKIICILEKYNYQGYFELLKSYNINPSALPSSSDNTTQTKQFTNTKKNNNNNINNNNEDEYTNKKYYIKIFSYINEDEINIIKKLKKDKYEKEEEKKLKELKLYSNQSQFNKKKLKFKPSTSSSVDSTTSSTPINQEIDYDSIELDEEKILEDGCLKYLTINELKNELDDYLLEKLLSSSIISSCSTYLSEDILKKINQINDNVTNNNDENEDNDEKLLNNDNKKNILINFYSNFNHYNILNKLKHNENFIKYTKEYDENLLKKENLLEYNCLIGEIFSHGTNNNNENDVNFLPLPSPPISIPSPLTTLEKHNDEKKNENNTENQSNQNDENNKLNENNEVEKSNEENNNEDEFNLMTNNLIYRNYLHQLINFLLTFTNSSSKATPSSFLLAYHDTHSNSFDNKKREEVFNKEINKIATKIMKNKKNNDSNQNKNNQQKSLLLDTLPPSSSPIASSSHNNNEAILSNYILPIQPSRLIHHKALELFTLLPSYSSQAVDQINNLLVGKKISSSSSSSSSSAPYVDSFPSYSSHILSPGIELITLHTIDGPCSDYLGKGQGQWLAALLASTIPGERFDFDANISEGGWRIIAVQKSIGVSGIKIEEEYEEENIIEEFNEEYEEELKNDQLRGTSTILENENEEENNDNNNSEKDVDNNEKNNEINPENQPIQNEINDNDKIEKKVKIDTELNISSANTTSLPSPTKSVPLHYTLENKQDKFKIYQYSLLNILTRHIRKHKEKNVEYSKQFMKLNSLLQENNSDEIVVYSGIILVTGGLASTLVKQFRTSDEMSSKIDELNDDKINKNDEVSLSSTSSMIYANNNQDINLPSYCIGINDFNAPISSFNTIENTTTTSSSTWCVEVSLGNQKKNPSKDFSLEYTPSLQCDNYFFQSYNNVDGKNEINNQHNNPYTNCEILIETKNSQPDSSPALRLKLHDVYSNQVVFEKKFVLPYKYLFDCDDSIETKVHFM